MATPIRRWMTALGLGTALAAGCQALPSAQPAAPAGARAMLAAYRQAMGLPAQLGRPLAAAASRGAPGFGVQANDSLWGAVIGVSTAARGQEAIDLAYNTSAKAYLAVWHDFGPAADESNADIRAQVISNLGTASGAPVTVCGAAGLQVGARVAYNPVANEYMIAWTDARGGDSDVYTQRLTGAGALSGGPTLVATGAGNQTLHALAHHPTTNQYLATWTDDAAGGPVLKAARLSALNAKTGADVTVSGAAGALANGATAVNPASGDYLVAWADARSPGAGIYAQRVTSAGALAGGALSVAAAAGYEYYAPKLVHNPVTPGYLLVYDRRTTATGEADAFAQRLTGAAALNGAATPLTTAAGPQLLPAVAVNNADGNYLAVWSDGRVGNEDLDLYAKVLRPDGSVHLAEHVVSAEANVQAMPAVAFDSTRKQFLMGWQDARAYAANGYDLYAQRAASAPLTADEVLAETLEVFEQYVTGTAGGAGGAQAQLEQAISKLAADKPQNAINHLNNFLGSLPTMQSNGVITASERAVLENMANEAIAQIQAGNY